MSATPQYNWPLLSTRAGCDLWLKHENHAALGAFKTRGALVYFRRLHEAGAGTGVAVAATRGNFGQAVTFAARLYHMQAVIYVPRGNSPSKNRAMTALGARLVEHGDNFEESRSKRCVGPLPKGTTSSPVSTRGSPGHRDIFVRTLPRRAGY